jgi:hypothetical protein
MTMQHTHETRAMTHSDSSLFKSFFTITLLLAGVVLGGVTMVKITQYNTPEHFISCGIR